ncbi:MULTISPECIES: F0F1 ATP synthase subunit B [Bacillales]|jgi:F-type H+-transporting ATPase subunit b|uniref:ATP synthase subunit b n=1 Tax=Brevibacillus aydinogluensis TaxID=927786 RepID=A0AA48RCG6_9BACL|nr:MULTISPECIES: F0F1 ATP synthase subunit B [Bacillales]REK67974.1 MAG: ATP synthase F0 subunit B [Brevibacillus sp.]MBR8659736.1 F0F1 ATP synthase subunit B [Brevibacillus sp. NL20B1]MDT3416663.1 F-type H+-transporting ATPase subunit b [Brevibacillus aydinogluensis]NNV01280.1 ATP synthase F0 subunit B [Brevibacillus sp. MCWH]UFJ62018.1 F0F1 ATP synthase subunit B [Anoxybacillus sediminis]
MLDFGAVALEWGSLLTQAIVFLLLLLAVRKFAMGPIVAVMEKRRQHIENEITTAERSRKEAEALLAEQRRVLDEARLEAKSIIDRATKQASDEAAKIVADAQAAAERMKADASAELAREVEKAKAELRDQMTGLSVLLASKIIEKELDEATQKATIDKFLAQVGDRL